MIKSQSAMPKQSDRFTSLKDSVPSNLNDLPEMSMDMSSKSFFTPPIYQSGD
jgi:hypothetical protein